MELLGAIFNLLLTILSILWSIIWWFVSFFLMPLVILLIIIIIALRYAYRTPMLKPYVESLLRALGTRGQKWAKQLVLSVTVTPIRILLRFIGFSILHAWVNLWWRPKWTPWQKAIEPPRTDARS